MRADEGSIGADLGENSPLFIKSLTENMVAKNLKEDALNAESLVGRSYLQESESEDGQRFRCEVVQAIKEHDQALGTSKERQRYIVKINRDGDDAYEDIVTYNEIVNHIERDNDLDNPIWRFKRILAHQGPLTSTSPDYKGSRYNVLVLWESGEQTYEPLSIVGADDPVTCALYARKHDLLEEPGW